MGRSIMSRLLLSALALLALGDVTLGRPSEPQPLPPATVLERFLAHDPHALVQYRALRRLTASTRGGRMTATIEAWTTLDPIHGFTFQVVHEEGSPLIRRKALVALLEAEQRTRGGPDPQQAALTDANYEFLDVSVVSPSLVKVDLRPRRRHVMLVDGALFLDVPSGDLVRIEGQLSKRPSIWTRQVRIVREYRRIDGVQVPVTMSSTADVRVVGESTFAMTYAYAEINDRPVPP
jgi:hypothetical protein